jgi:hypothetical protein
MKKVFYPTTFAGNYRRADRKNLQSGLWIVTACRFTSVNVVPPLSSGMKKRAQQVIKETIDTYAVIGTRGGQTIFRVRGVYDCRILSGDNRSGYRQADHN